VIQRVAGAAGFGEQHFQHVNGVMLWTPLSGWLL
jgi:hypothetical protein